MSSALASVYLSGNNLPLLGEIGKCLKKNNLRIENKKASESDYRLLFFDVSDPVDNFSKTIMEELDDLAGYSGKVCLVLASNDANDDPRADNLQSVIQTYLSNRKNNLRLILTRDLFQEEGAGPLDQFENRLCQIAKIGVINATADGSVKYHPTSLNDLCDLIIKSLFITSTAGQTFVAVSEELTDLELAYLLKKTLEKVNLNLEINLNGKEKRESEDLMDRSIQTQALLNWIPKTNFSDVISLIIGRCQNQDEESEWAVSHQKENKPSLHKLEPITSTKKKTNWSSITPLLGFIKKFTKRQSHDGETNLHEKEKNVAVRTAVIVLVGIISLAILPVIVSFASLYFSTTQTYQAFQEIRVGHEKEARAQLNRAKLFHTVTTSTFRSIIPIGNLVAKDMTNKTNDYLLILGHGQSLLDSVLETYSLGDQLYRGLLGKQSVDTKTLVAALRVNLVSISERLSQVELLLGQVELPFGFADRINRSSVDQSINLLKSQINLAIPILDLLDKVGSNQGVQRYLMVIQDTNELRPTGGFISTYGIFTLDQGKVINFQIDSSLSLDRLIEGKIEPPGIVKQLLGQSNWSFHDSNLDADFNNSARQMSWFYQRFKNVTVDGVIGINLNLLRFMLEQIGPVSLADGQTVSVDNLLVLASNPTASKGLDVITALTQTLGQKLVNAEISFAHLSRSLLKAIAYNEINAWFSAPALESLADVGGISGRIKAQDCHAQLASLKCRADTIYLNESNMSINKLNFYLRRNQNLTVEIGETGIVNYHLGYDYTYPVPAPINLGGLYKAYYQLYLPSSSQNISLVLDGQAMDLATLIQTSLSGLTKIEFSAGLSTNQPHRLEIRFTSPNVLDVKKQLIPYTLALLKQPGTLTDTLTVKFHYPKNFSARNMTLPLKQTGASELVFQTNQISQENLGIIFKNEAL